MIRAVGWCGVGELTAGTGVAVGDPACSKDKMSKSMPVPTSSRRRLPHRSRPVKWCRCSASPGGSSR
jgi:hypothetical protein